MQFVWAVTKAELCEMSLMSELSQNTSGMTLEQHVRCSNLRFKTPTPPNMQSLRAGLELRICLQLCTSYPGRAEYWTP